MDTNVRPLLVGTYCYCVESYFLVEKQIRRFQQQLAVSDKPEQRNLSLSNMVCTVCFVLVYFNDQTWLLHLLCNYTCFRVLADSWVLISCS